MMANTIQNGHKIEFMKNATNILYSEASTHLDCITDENTPHRSATIEYMNDILKYSIMLYLAPND